MKSEKINTGTNTSINTVSQLWNYVVPPPVLLSASAIGVLENVLRKCCMNILH